MPVPRSEIPEPNWSWIIPERRMRMYCQTRGCSFSYVMEAAAAAPAHCPKCGGCSFKREKQLALSFPTGSLIEESYPT